MNHINQYIILLFDLLFCKHLESDDGSFQTTCPWKKIYKEIHHMSWSDLSLHNFRNTFHIIYNFNIPEFK